MATRDGSSAGTPALDSLVKDIHPRLSELRGEPSAGFKKEAWANADGVARDLVARSALLRKAWESGELWVVGVISVVGHLPLRLPANVSTCLDIRERATKRGPFLRVAFGRDPLRALRVRWKNLKNLSGEQRGIAPTRVSSDHVRLGSRRRSFCRRRPADERFS